MLAPRLLLFHEHRNPDGNRRQRDCGVSQSNGRDLVAASANAVGALHNGFADEVADSQRDVADHQAGDDAESGVDDEAENCAAGAEEQAAHKNLVRILRLAQKRLFAAVIAGGRAVDAIILRAERLPARLAAFRAGTAGIFRGPKLWRRFPRVEHDAHDMTEPKLVDIDLMS